MNGYFLLLCVLPANPRKNRAPRSGCEPLTCSLRVGPTQGAVGYGSFLGRAWTTAKSQPPRRCATPYNSRAALLPTASGPAVGPSLGLESLGVELDGWRSSGGAGDRFAADLLCPRLAVRRHERGSGVYGSPTLAHVG